MYVENMYTYLHTFFSNFLKHKSMIFDFCKKRDHRCAQVPKQLSAFCGLSNKKVNKQAIGDRFLYSMMKMLSLCATVVVLFSLFPIII